jgi:hypothetical protein
MNGGQTPASTGDLVAKLLAVFDAVSVFTIMALAIAGLAVLELPSPLFGIDLTPVRVGLTGAILAGATILAACLVVAKNRAGCFRAAIKAL